MGKLILQYFGVLAEIAGTNKQEWEIKRDLNALKAELLNTYPKIENYNVIYAVNNAIANGNVHLSANDTVALMPPFSGG